MKHCDWFRNRIPRGPFIRGLLVAVGLVSFLTATAQVPTAPGNFYVISEDGQNELYWSANPASEGVVEYTIYRSLDRVNFSSVATVPASAITQYVDNAVENDITYFYYLTASNPSGEGPVSAVDAGVPASDFNKFMAFDGVSDSITIADSDQLQLADQSFTIELWVRIRRLPLGGNEANLVGRFEELSNNEAFSLRIFENTGQLEFRTRALSASRKRTVETLNENEWYHIAISYDNDTQPFVAADQVRIYINGVLTTAHPASSANILDPQSTPAGNLVLGGDMTVSNRFFNGYIDDLRIWDRVRTPAEIMNAQCTRFRGDETGLVGLWHFDEEVTVAPVAYDYTINANNGGENIENLDFKPLARDDFGRTHENIPVNVNIQGNDVSTSARPLVGALIPGYPLSGNANLVDNDSTVSYSPNNGFFGIDTLKYALSDTAVFCNTIEERDTATVLVYVQCNEKDELNWNEKALGVEVANTTLIESGLFIDFSTRDPANIQTSLTTASGLQGINSVVWEQDPGTNAELTATTITFNRPAAQFCFDLLDIDADPAGFTDSVVVNAYHEGEVVTLYERDFVLGTALDFKGDNSFTGNALVDDISSTAGNVSLCFFVAIDSIEIIFTNAVTAPANPSMQNIGIGNFEWCAFANNAPVIRDQAGVAIDSLFYTIAMDSSLNVCLNVTDVDGDNTSITTVGNTSANGTVTVTDPASACVAYSPSAGFTGTETFTVTVCDNRADQLCDVVTISVLSEESSTPPPPPPPPPVDPPVDPPSTELFVSEALSPNGDGILDHWEITGIETFGNNYVKVFNIWGDLVFERARYNNQERAWRGQVSQGAVIGNEEAPDATYFYILDLGNGNSPLKGYVVLKR